MSKCQLKVVEIGRNRLEDKGARALAKLLAEKRSLVRVAVQQNGIKEDGIIELLKSIRLNKELKEIYLNDNWIKGEDAIALLDDVLHQCRELRVLDLSDNCIGNVLSTRIFKMLARSAGYLRELYYNYNELGHEPAIIECLEMVLRLPRLRVIELEGNGISKQLAEEYGYKLKGVAFKLNEEDVDE